MWNSIWHFVDEWRNKLTEESAWFPFLVWIDLESTGGNTLSDFSFELAMGSKFRWPWVVYLVQWLNCSWIRGRNLGREFLWPLLVSLWGRSWGFYSVLTLASNLFKNFYDYSLCRPMWFVVRGFWMVCVCSSSLQWKFLLDGLCLLMLSSVKLSARVCYIKIGFYCPRLMLRKDYTHLCVEDHDFDDWSFPPTSKLHGEVRAPYVNWPMHRVLPMLASIRVNFSNIRNSRENDGILVLPFRGGRSCFCVRIMYYFQMQIIRWGLGYSWLSVRGIDFVLSADKIWRPYHDTLMAWIV